MRVGTVVVPTLWMKKLRHREGKSFPNVTQLISAELEYEPRPPVLIQGNLWQMPPEWYKPCLSSFIDCEEGRLIPGKMIEKVLQRR